MAFAPSSEAELFSRAERLTGKTLGELALADGAEVPPDQRRAKGWVGQLVERTLGADAGSRACPDFDRLGIELKTLPVDGSGRPRETTFVCTIAPLESGRVEWEDSHLRRKLARVLWIPIEANPDLPLGKRRVGAAILWSPNKAQENALKEDFELLTGLIARGCIDDVTAHLGEVLQVRPKAAHGRARRIALDEEGGLLPALPRGFYLRTRFTAEILRDNCVLPR